MGENQVTPSAARTVECRLSRYPRHYPAPCHSFRRSRRGWLLVSHSTIARPAIPELGAWSLVLGAVICPLDLALRSVILPQSDQELRDRASSPARNNGSGTVTAADALPLLGARRVLMGRGGACVLIALLMLLYADHTFFHRSLNEISGLSKATSSNASMQATARGGQAGCGVTGGQLGCSRPTSSRYSQKASARRPDQSARCPAATRPAPGAHPRSRGPFASPLRPIPKRRITQQPRSPRHGRRARLSRVSLRQIPSITRVRLPACRLDEILPLRELDETLFLQEPSEALLLQESSEALLLQELSETLPLRQPGEALPPRRELNEPILPRSLDETLLLHQAGETSPPREPLVLAPGDRRPHRHTDPTGLRSPASTHIT